MRTRALSELGLPLYKKQRMDNSHNQRCHMHQMCGTVRGPAAGRDACQEVQWHGLDKYSNQQPLAQRSLHASSPAVLLSGVLT